MLDYDEDSEISIWARSSESVTHYRGTAEIRELFTGLFESLGSAPVNVPIEDVVERPGEKSVFLVWSAPDAGFLKATDTFIFDNNFKIRRQNIVTVTDSTVREAWDNHFEVFGKGVAAGARAGENKTLALKQIMLDYDDNSIVRLHNDETAEKSPQVFKGHREIRDMFDNLFTDLAKCNGDGDNQLKAPLDQVREHPQGQVFLIWQCPLAGFNAATDTFIMDGAKIRGQNIVVSRDVVRIQPVSGFPSVSVADALLSRGQQVRSSQADYNPTTVQAAWDNHFSAFGGQDVDQIMLDYDEDSEISIWARSSESVTHYRGTAEIRELFTGLFKSLGSAPVNAPIEDVVDRPGEKSVFLVWSAPDAGFLKATDTFIFDKNFKIRRQNIVKSTSD